MYIPLKSSKALNNIFSIRIAPVKRKRVENLANDNFENNFECFEMSKRSAKYQRLFFCHSNCSRSFNKESNLNKIFMFF
jgi:hypothetical protein